VSTVQNLGHLLQRYLWFNFAFWGLIPRGRKCPEKQTNEETLNDNTKTLHSHLIKYNAELGKHNQHNVLLLLSNAI